MASKEDLPASMSYGDHESRIAEHGHDHGIKVRLPSFLNTALGLVRQPHRFYRSPRRFVELLWGFVANIRTQLEILRIVTRPHFMGLIRSELIFPFKYLTRDYLARGLTISERAACFVHHHRRIVTVFPPAVLHRILHEELDLFEWTHETHVFTIRMARVRDKIREGELDLWLEVDGLGVFTLQFTVIPGWVVKSKAEDVFLISRLQGIVGLYSQIRLATKAFHEIAPPALLLAALEGIAMAFPKAEMAGVCAESQFSYEESCAALFKSAYDAFWAEIGAGRVTENFFVGPLPAQEKPLSGIQNGHKARTRKKRAFKRKVAEDVFNLLYLGVNPDPRTETRGTRVPGSSERTEIECSTQAVRSAAL